MNDTMSRMHILILSNRNRVETRRECVGRALTRFKNYVVQWL